jgi:hypothetical protein
VVINDVEEIRRLEVSDEAGRVAGLHGRCMLPVIIRDEFSHE